MSLVYPGYQSVFFVAVDYTAIYVLSFASHGRCSPYTVSQSVKAEMKTSYQSTPFHK